jgi:hypothetical protein
VSQPHGTTIFEECIRKKKEIILRANFENDNINGEEVVEKEAD